mmetsp:Transcript_12198/g.12279  ORF Transcript_12198/g.12279 Transcript_12198/m.12279 type:complete len:484 (-) Transcript_12198:256-1707(-)
MFELLQWVCACAESHQDETKDMEVDHDNEETEDNRNNFLSNKSQKRVIQSAIPSRRLIKTNNELKYYCGMLLRSGGRCSEQFTQCSECQRYQLEFPPSHSDIVIDHQVLEVHKYRVKKKKGAIVIKDIDNKTGIVTRLPKGYIIIISEERDFKNEKYLKYEKGWVKATSVRPIHSKRHLGHGEGAYLFYCGEQGVGTGLCGPNNGVQCHDCMYYQSSWEGYFTAMNKYYRPFFLETELVMSVFLHYLDLALDIYICHVFSYYNNVKYFVAQCFFILCGLVVNVSMASELESLSCGARWFSATVWTQLGVNSVIASLSYFAEIFFRIGLYVFAFMNTQLFGILILLLEFIFRVVFLVLVKGTDTATVSKWGLFITLIDTVGHDVRIDFQLLVLLYGLIFIILMWLVPTHSTRALKFYNLNIVITLVMSICGMMKLWLCTMSVKEIEDNRNGDIEELSEEVIVEQDDDKHKERRRSSLFTPVEMV